MYIVSVCHAIAAMSKRRLKESKKTSVLDVN